MYRQEPQQLHNRLMLLNSSCPRVCCDGRDQDPQLPYAQMAGGTVDHSGLPIHQIQAGMGSIGFSDLDAVSVTNVQGEQMQPVSVLLLQLEKAIHVRGASRSS